MLTYCKTNETFMKLWMEIPEVINHNMYINLLNQIDNEYMDDYLTATEEKILINALEAYMITRKIKKEEG